MIRKIKEVASIKSGVFAKSGANTTVFYVQSNDFDRDYKWKENLQPQLSLDERLTKHLLEIGDVLYVSKGHNRFAVVYDGTYAPAVASTTFFRLKVDKTKVSFGYLAWFLNHPTTTSIISGLVRGSGIPSVSKSSLGEIAIIVPSLEKQKLIVSASQLQRREENLLGEISRLRKLVINEQLYKSLI